MKLGIRAILAIAFVIASAVPLSVWAVWVSASALDQEIAEVEDRHLLLAKNLRRALDRYVQDVTAVFEHVTESAVGTRGSDHLGRLLSSLDFRHICLIDTDTRRVTSVTVSEDTDLSSLALPPLDEFVEKAERGLGRLVFTNVRHNPNGLPAIYVVKKVDHGTISLGELGTGYLRDTQRAVAFGEGGHAAIVDGAGNVLGHPNAQWELEIKNIAKVDAVARMMRGETGVSQFFSPAAKKEMIAGFTTVPSTGWGVMIPQPLEELEARAEEVRQFSYLVVALGGFVAAVSGWIIGGFVARPIQAVSDAADVVASGRADVSVSRPRGIAPAELDVLAQRFNDMTDALNQSRKTQGRALRAAEEAAEAKSDFVARVTHELRTPLNTVIGFSGMIRDQAHGAINRSEYVDYARLIHDSGQRLLEMVNDIIAYARIDGRSESLNETVVDISKAVIAAIDHVSDRARDGGVALTSTVDDGLPNLWADDIKLRQAITHLLSNAVKFTPRGGSAHIDASLTDNGGLAVTVTDSGIGIAEADIPVALSPFGQISSQLARAYEGAGLGLPLSKMLIELHGGSLRLRSEPGEGTTVTLTLPPERVGVSAAMRDRMG